MCKLRYLREKQKISQIGLAEELNIPKPYISMWEYGKCIPNREFTQKFADYFNVTIDEFLE